MKQKKAIVFFSAGLGDAVLLIPLVKWLKKQGFAVTGFFNSVHPCEEIFGATTLLDKMVVCKNKEEQILFSAKKIRKYTIAYVNYFAANRKNIITASLVAKQVITNKEIHSAATNLFKTKIKYVAPVKHIHDAQQNILLAENTEKILLEDFYIGLNAQQNQGFPTDFIAVQVSAGNNKITYKNWPVEYWIEFLQLLLQKYPSKKIVLLGDTNEVQISDKIIAVLGNQVSSFIGKTSITEVMAIISASQLFIGLDGGLMHLAAALQKPTFTLWGPSSIELYGYETFNSIRHKCVSLNLSCNPCSAWINANHTKATSPETCPDHACLQQLMPNDVFNQFTEFLSLINAS